jgi:hypothetical protein
MRESHRSKTARCGAPIGFDRSALAALCHPERSEIVRKANDLAESKDPESAGSATNTSGNSDGLPSLVALMLISA